MTISGYIYYAFRWTHFLAGITWIGLLYYFNFVQTPFMAEADAATKPGVVEKLLPRALWWFRWGAMFTFLSGLGMLGLRFHEASVEQFYSGYAGWGITIGGLMATIMFLNVWLVIWPKQQIVMKSAAQVKAGGQALPEAPAAARRGFLASRTNTLLSIGMLFFMGSFHFMGFGMPDATAKMVVLIGSLVILGVIEFSALMGDKGPLTKPLDTVKSVIWSGFAVAALLIILFAATFGVVVT